MGATAANPMERVRRIAQQKELIARGLATESDFVEQVSNKVIMTSSAYYSFNHMYDRIQVYEQKVREGDKRYASHNISFKNMSEGFLDMGNIEEARATNTEDQFAMEYGAEWVSDSAGIFKASLIEKCRQNANHTVKLSGDSGKEYVLGIDPARTRDAFALCLLELGKPNKVVAAWEYFKVDFPTMASYVMEICDKFNVTGINMDSGGGGLAVKDLLAERARFGNQCILDADDDETEFMDGRRILHMINFSPRSISEMNYGSLNLMEKDWLTFPRGPQYFTSVPANQLDDHEKVHSTVESMINQLLSIEVTESKAGVAHFDLPEGGHGKRKKDLYTAFILGSKLAYDLTLMEEDSGGILQLGIVTPLSTTNFQRSGGSNLSDSMGVTQSLTKGWNFRNTFKK
jgi:hypothetical protein